MGTRVRRILKFLGLGLATVVILSGLAYVFRIPLFGELIRERVEATLNESLGGRFSVGSVEGSLLGDLRVLQVETLEAPTVGGVRRIAFSEAHVTYDIIDIVFGDAPLGAIQSLTVKDLDLHVVSGDLDPHKVSGEDEGSGKLPSFATDPIDDPLPTLDIQGRLRLELGGRPFRAGDVRIASLGPDSIRLRIADVYAGDEAVPGAIDGVLLREDPTRLTWNSTTRLGGVGLPEVAYRTDGHLKARLETGGGAVQALLSPTQVRAETVALDLAGLPAWVRALLPEASPLPTRGKLVGHAELSRPERIRVDAAFELLALRWREIDARRVACIVHTDDEGIIRLDRVDAAVGGASLSIRDGHLDPTYRYWLRSVRSIEIDIPDLAAVVPGYVRKTALALVAEKGEGDRLDIRRFDLRDERGRMQGGGRLELPGDPAQPRAARIDVQVEGELHNVGFMELDPLQGSLALTGRIQGELDSLRGSLRRTGGNATIQGQLLESLTFRGILEDFSTVRVLEAAVSSAATTAIVRGTLDLAGEEARLALDAAIEVGELAAWVPGETVTGAARLKAHIGGTPARVELDGQIDAGPIAFGDTSITTVDAKVALRDGRLALTALEAESEAGRATAGAVLDLEGAWLRLTSLGVTRPDGTRFALREPLEGALAEGVIRVPRVSARLDEATFEAGPIVVVLGEGRARLEALIVSQADLEVGLGTPLALTWEDGVIATEDLDLRMEPDTRARASLSADLGERRVDIRSLVVSKGEREGHLEAPLVVSLADERIVLHGVAARVDDWRLRADASVALEARHVEVEALRLRGHELDIALASSAKISWDDTGVAISELDVRALGGRIQGEAAWRGKPSAQLEARGLDLSPYLEGAEGRADLNVQLDGEAGRVALRVPALTWKEETLAIDGLVEQSAAGGLLLKALRIRDERGADITGRAKLPWRVGAGGLARLPEVAPTLHLEGTLPRLSSFVEAHSGVPSIVLDGDATGLHGRVRIPDLLLKQDVGPRNDGELAFEISPAASHASFRLADDGIVRIEGAARVGRGLDWTDPRDLARFLDGPLEGRLDAEVCDWEPLKPVLNRLRRIEGNVSMTLQLGGSLRAPTVEGEVVTRDAAVEVARDIPVLSSLDSRLVWKNDRLTIQAFEGEMGYAPFKLGGHIDQLFRDVPTFDLTFRGKNVLAARSDAMRLRADVDLRMRGPLDALVTTGSLDVASLLYVKPISMSGGGPDIAPLGFQLFRIEDGPLSTMRFDVAIRADKTIRIRNNLARGRMSANLRLRGTGKSPEPEGRVVVGQASVFLPATTLHLKGAEVVFPPGDPRGPRVRATARSRASGYELGVRIMGRLPDLEVVIYSRPRLSDEDAMLLLALGSTTGAAGSTGVKSVALQKTVEFFGKSLFSYARASADPDTRPFFDRFSVTVGRESSRRGNDTIETELGLTEKIYLTVDRDRYDDTNLGFLWRLRFP